MPHYLQGVCLNLDPDEIDVETKHGKRGSDEVYYTGLGREKKSDRLTLMLYVVKGVRVYLTGLGWMNADRTWPRREGIFEGRITQEEPSKVD